MQSYMLANVARCCCFSFYMQLANVATFCTYHFGSNHSIVAIVAASPSCDQLQPSISSFDAGVISFNVLLAFSSRHANSSAGCNHCSEKQRRLAPRRRGWHAWKNQDCVPPRQVPIRRETSRVWPTFAKLGTGPVLVPWVAWACHWIFAAPRNQQQLPLSWPPRSLRPSRQQVGRPRMDFLRRHIRRQSCLSSSCSSQQEAQGWGVRIRCAQHYGNLQFLVRALEPEIAQWATCMSIASSISYTLQGSLKLVQNVFLFSMHVSFLC